MIPFEDARQAAFGRSTLNGDSFTALYQACKSIEALQGKVVEIGVGRGGSAKFLMRCLPDKEFDLFDLTDEAATFLAQDNAASFRLNGSFPDSLTCAFADQPVALVHVDVDDRDTILAALDFFWSEIVVGGMIVLPAYETAKAVIAQVKEQGGLEDNTYTVETIEVPGSIGTLKIVRTAEDDDALFEDDFEYEDEPTPEMKQVEVLQDEEWTSVDSLLAVKEGDIFRMKEPDETEFGERMVATGDGYLNDDDVPTIMCEKALEPREEGDVPEGMTAEPITAEELASEGEGEEPAVEEEVDDTTTSSSTTAIDDLDDPDDEEDDEVVKESVSAVDKLASGKVSLSEDDDPEMKRKDDGEKKPKTGKKGKK